MQKWGMVVVGALLISACAGPKARQLDNPFAKDRQSAPIRKLAVALVFPKIDVTKKAKQIESPELARANQDDPGKLYREPLGIYYQDFKSVTLVKSLSDPRVSQADIVVAVDLKLEVSPPTLTWTSLFYGPDHGLITNLKTQVSAPGGLFAPRPEEALKLLLPQVPEKLDQQLQASTELKHYAQNLAPRPGAGVAPRPEVQPIRAIDSDVDRPAYSFEENSANFAVVVGVENYQSLPTAEFAGRDAHAVRAHLRALGYPSQNVVMLNDSQATGNTIRSYVESWLPRNVKPESKVFFYFSGHGAPDTESKQAYLVPWDADPQFLADTGYPVKKLYQKLNALNAKRVVVAMDACFSGAGGHSVLAKGARPLMTRVDAGDGDVGKIVVLAAAGSEEITGSEESQGHGLFTYYLLKGLNESAGKHGPSQAYGYLKPKVEEAARRANRGQTPQLIGALDQNESLR